MGAPSEVVGIRPQREAEMKGMNKIKDNRPVEGSVRMITQHRII